MESFKLLLMLASAIFIAKPYGVNAQEQEPDCRADVEFVLDVSSSLGTSVDFPIAEVLNSMWEFVRGVVGRYPLSSDGIHAGVIYFSTNSTNLMKLESRTSTESFLEIFNNLVKDLKWGGDTYTNKALKLAEDQLYKEVNRKDAKKHIILVTDGGQSGGGKELQELYGIADRLRKNGVTIIGFGVGPALMNFKENQEQLKKITGGNYHLLNDFNALDKHLSDVQLNCGKSCVDEAFEKAVDVAFLIDSSERATDYFERELNLVKAIVKAFKIKLDGNRAGLISYGSAVVETIELGTENTVEKFNQAVSNLKKEGGKRSIDKAMDRAYRLFGNSHAGNKFVLAFTDGNMSEGESREALENTRLLKTQDSLLVIFIAMKGDGTVSPYLELLAQAGEIAPIVNPEKKEILAKICKPQKEPCPSEVYTCKKLRYSI